MTLPARLALVTDAWEPQVNGVVRTLSEVVRHLRAAGCEVLTITPDRFAGMPCPTYPEIRLAWPRGVAGLLDSFAPQAVHIATEGPLGMAARAHCLKRGWPFTTSFHTKFPEYVHARLRLPVAWGYRYLRWFHAPAARMLTATHSLRADLQARGFANAHPWTRGVDIVLFHPAKRAVLPYPRPLLLYVGRLAVEKNIEAFLNLPHGTHLVVGDGPQRQELQRRYPKAIFLGARQGEELARYYAAADVLVFPSRTDTFGLVMLEALASGTPVAAYPVTGPRDVLTDPQAAAMDERLEAAVARALTLDRARCRAFAESFSWEVCAALFGQALAPIRR